MIVNNNSEISVQTLIRQELWVDATRRIYDDNKHVVNKKLYPTNYNIIDVVEMLDSFKPLKRHTNNSDGYFSYQFFYDKALVSAMSGVITFDGESEFVSKLLDAVSKIIKSVNGKRFLNYAFSNARGDLQNMNLEMSTNPSFNEKLYPYIENGAYNKMLEFKNSSAPILILLGPPGTGKTTFLREYITRHTSGHPYVVYDEKTSINEELYINYLESGTNLMVFEDADNLMSDRIKDNNKNLNKILNLANGLLNIGAKKFIFTANITDINLIDQALIRPGRCFEVINFRALSSKELKDVAEEMNITFDFEGPHTISEMFNNKQKPEATPKMGRIGF